MRLAVTAAGPDLRAAVDPRFGRCEWFLILDTDGMSLECNEEAIRLVREES